MDTIASGTYTIVGPKGGHRTVKISNDDFAWMRTPPPAGTRIVAAMTGADNENSFTGIGHISPAGELTIWRKQEFRNDFIAAARWLLKNGAGQEVKLGTAYALLSKRCWICNLKLTNPASHAHGYGKKCAQNRGLPWDPKATPAAIAA